MEKIKQQHWLVWGVLILCVGYLLQLPGHARMMNDTLSYFARAHNFMEGRGLNFDDGYVNHPVGYSILLAGMIRTGLGNVWAFIAVNLIALLASLAMLWGHFRGREGLSRPVSAGVLIVFLLSWTVVKHVPMLYTEILFLMLAVATVRIADRAAERRGWSRLILILVALALTVAATLTRTIGVVLIGSVAWSAVGGSAGILPWIDWAKRTRARMIGVVATGGVITVACAAVMMSSRYFENLVYRFRVEESPLLRLLHFRLSEVGKLVLNAPERLVPPSFYFVIYIAGAVFFVLMFMGLYRRRREWGAAEIYVLGTAAVIGIWQSFDTRFWLPALPFILVLQWHGVKPWLARCKPLAWLGVGWLGVYAVLGLAAMGWSTRLTYSGQDYASRDMFFPKAYKVAYGQADMEILNTENQRRAVNIIRLYDPRTPAELRDQMVPLDPPSDPVLNQTAMPADNKNDSFELSP
ncbi:MAG: hypothetical protein AAGA25_05290 [Planctomycetota bacterium]